MDKNLRILIVDDEPETLKGYQEFLAPLSQQKARQSSRRSGKVTEDTATQDEKFILYLASSGEEAVEVAQTQLSAGRPIAAGFFDVKLGAGIDGLETIRQIKGLDSRIHCVVVTAYHDRSVEDIHHLFGEDFKDQWDYLNKPFTRGEILQKAIQMLSAWNRKRELEALQQQLIRSERMAAIGQVARGVGHEFGNILLRIIGKADLAMLEDDPDKVRKDLDIILTAAERAGLLARNLQSFSKTEPRFQLDSVTRSIDQALSLIHHELIKSSVEVKTSFTSDTQTMLDSSALSQVFLNLFINAMHAMKEKGGTLHVRVNEKSAKDGNSYLFCEVEDTGVGIDEDVLPNIFEYAFSTKGDQGSGLGLAITKDIVESHGGSLTVRTVPGSGTTFTVQLPIKDF